MHWAATRVQRRWRHVQRARIPRLPPELWERILATSGPLRMAPHVGVRVTCVAAFRIQRAWRRIAQVPQALYRGAHVVVRMAPGVWRGTVDAVSDGMWCVRLACVRRRRYIFLPHLTTTRVRVLQTR